MFVMLPDDLFSLLYNLSTSHSDDSEIGSLACSALVSLSIAVGRPGPILQAATGLLIEAPSNAYTEVIDFHREYLITDIKVV